MGRSAAARQGKRKGDFLAGKYLLEDCLGIGGMGEVYRATNVSLGREVAIKLLSPEFVHIEEDVLRFLREARAAAAVRHTNVVDVLDVARDEDGTPFIVQELLSGEDLEHYLRARGRLSWTEALDIMVPVADAVAAAHARDVVHRDLKPANIFLARDRDKVTPKVLDFGACLFPTIADRTAKEVRMLIGTPHYMAPEQIVSKADVDARSDVWAIGVMVYEMIVGETPFEADSAKAVLELVKTRDVPPLRQRAKDAPVELEELIAQCTKRDRLARLPNAAAVHERMAAVRKLGERASTKTAAGKLGPPASAGKPSPKRALLTLNSPGSEPPPSPDDLPVIGLPVATRQSPPPPPPSLDRPAPPASVERPVLGRVDLKKMPRARVVDETSGPTSASDPRISEQLRAFDPSGVREVDLDPPPSAPDLDLAARPSSWPPAGKSDSGPVSSLPPVLDPRAAARAAPDIPPPPAAPHEFDVDLPRSTPEPAPPKPVAEEAPASKDAAARAAPEPTKDKDAARPTALGPESLATSRVQPRPAGTPGQPASWPKLLAAVLGPAVAGLLAVRLVPGLGAPIGRALRGDSTLASGVLAVLALVVAAALCARSLLGERTRSLVVAAAGSVLFGIAMIIVTFSASEAAELGVPSTTSGLPTFVGPIAPLALAVGALASARAAWARSYTRSDAIRSAVAAAVCLCLALVLSPIGAVRTQGPATPPRATSAP